MNGWHDSMSYAARERMNRFQQESARYRLLRAASAGQRGGALAGARRHAARALHRLAEALAPTPEAGAGGSGAARGSLPAGPGSPSS